jgi:hypothetical protein
VRDRLARLVPREPGPRLAAVPAADRKLANAVISTPPAKARCADGDEVRPDRAVRRRAADETKLPMLKEADNPPPLPPGVASVRDLAGDWWVAHTKSRAEKAFAWDLIGRGIPHFLPTVEREAVWGGRRRKVRTPLFPGYAFFCGDESARYEAMTTGRLCQAIPVKRRERFVEEVFALERAVLAGLKLELFPFAVAGRRCRVAAGPLRGIRGVIVRDADKSRLVLEVEILGQGASLEVSADLLEPVDD